jgi:glycerol-3-phosphate dehydrogenase
VSATEYDLTVVGGGIQGVGVAQRAAAGGWKVCLLESRQLAAGTSSKSSKLIHGGLRYLESFEFGLVRESLRERALLLRNAPELVRRVPFYIPIYGDTSRRPWQIRAGLSLYGLLTGFAEEGKFRSLARSQWNGLDGLKTTGLQAVFEYTDAQTDDAALTRAVMASAQELGALLLQPAELQEAQRIEAGYRVRYTMSGEQHEHNTRVLVNAGGPWVEQVRSRVSPTPDGLTVDLVQGTHIELPGELTCGIYYTEAPQDGRAVFSMPWKGHTLVGTTEKLHEQAPEKCAPSREEVEYLQETFQHHFPGKDTQLLNSWAGLRVLPSARGSAFKRTRETQYCTDQKSSPHYLAIYGGKLTGYRATADAVLNRLVESLPASQTKALTEELRLHPVDAPNPP